MIQFDYIYIICFNWVVVQPPTRKPRGKSMTSLKCTPDFRQVESLGMAKTAAEKKKNFKRACGTWMCQEVSKWVIAY